MKTTVSWSDMTTNFIRRTSIFYSYLSYLLQALEISSMITTRDEHKPSWNSPELSRHSAFSLKSTLTYSHCLSVPCIFSLNNAWGALSQQQHLTLKCFRHSSDKTVSGDFRQPAEIGNMYWNKRTYWHNTMLNPGSIQNGCLCSDARDLWWKKEVAEKIKKKNIYPSCKMYWLCAFKKNAK